METRLFYTRMAEYYDRIYHYVDYKKQADFLADVIRKYNKSGSRKIIDIACGTGTHAGFLQRKGFEVTGLDISRQMLEVARRKNPGIRFIEGDMKRLDIGESFGAMTCFFNSILYNRNAAEMKRTLSGFYGHLDGGGVLVFDAVDRSIGINSKKEEYVYGSGMQRIVFSPQWILNEKGNVLDLDIDFTVNGRKINEHHVLGAFGFDELAQMLREAGFGVIILERDFDSIRPYESGSKSAIFVGRK